MGAAFALPEFGPGATFPGALAIGFHFVDYVVHGWDVARAIDAPFELPADVVAAVALGARFTLIGRAYLYGLMAGGEAGVDRAIQILSAQVTRTMGLLGVTCLEELAPRHVTQLFRLVPGAT